MRWVKVNNNCWPNNKFSFLALVTKFVSISNSHFLSWNWATTTTNAKYGQQLTTRRIRWWSFLFLRQQFSATNELKSEIGNLQDKKRFFFPSIVTFLGGFAQKAKFRLRYGLRQMSFPYGESEKKLWLNFICQSEKKSLLNTVGFVPLFKKFFSSSIW